MRAESACLGAIRPLAFTHLYAGATQRSGRCHRRKGCNPVPARYPAAVQPTRRLKYALTWGRLEKSASKAMKAIGLIRNRRTEDQFRAGELHGAGIRTLAMAALLPRQDSIDDSGRAGLLLRIRKRDVPAEAPFASATCLTRLCPEHRVSNRSGGIFAAPFLKCRWLGSLGNNRSLTHPCSRPSTGEPYLQSARAAGRCPPTCVPLLSTT